KTNPFTAADLDDFVDAFGKDAHGRAERVDGGEDGRFRRFTRAEIAARGDNLDITWLKDISGDPEDGLATPEEIAGAIEGHLKSALEEIAALVADMEADAPSVDVADLPEAAE